MMREYSPGSNSLAALDSPQLFPKNATCHSKNTEKWNDFHEQSGTYDSGKREYSHKELGDRMHDKLVEERHLEGPSGKADQWRKREYFESNKGGAHARVLRKEHALNEQKEHVTQNDGTTRKTSTHSSTVHVSTHMTTKTAMGEGGMDLLSLEDHSPLDHSPQKGKGSLSKQGALNQRRRPSKGSWRSNTSPERDSNADTYIKDLNEISSPRSLSTKVQKRNAENYWRSQSSVNNDSKYQTYSKKIVNDTSTVKSENRDWIRHKRDGKPEDLKIDSPRTSPLVGSLFCGTRTPPSEPDSKPADKERNSNVIVLNTGTWTRKDKYPRSSERLIRDTSKTEEFSTTDSQWSTRNSYRSQPRSPISTPERGRKFTLHEKSDYKHSPGTVVTLTSGRKAQTDITHSDSTNEIKQNVKTFDVDRRYTKSHSADTAKPVSQGVTIVEGPTTKLVSSFPLHEKSNDSWKKSSQIITSQRHGTYVKKERTSSERSPPTEVTINGAHPPTHSPTSSSKNRSSGSPSPTQRLPGARTNESNRKLGTGHVTKSDDQRTVIMNEIRSFDPKKLRNQRESTKVGTTTSWLEGRYAANNHIANTHREKLVKELDNNYNETRTNGISTKVHLSPHQKTSQYSNPHYHERPTNHVNKPIQVESNGTVQSFERTQSLPILESKVTVHEEVNSEDYFSSLVTADEEEDDDVEDELQWERFSDSGEEDIDSSWVIQRNIDWDKLEHKENFETEDQNILWKNRMDVLQQSPGPREYQSQNVFLEQVHLHPILPQSHTKSNSSFHIQEIELHRTSSPSKYHPVSFAVPQVNLRGTPSHPHLEPESFTIPQVQLRRAPSLPRQNPQLFELPEVSLRRTPSLPRLESDSFYVPEVSLRRTPSLPRLESDSFYVPEVQLRHTPSLPPLEPDHVSLPDFELRRTSSCSRLSPEPFRIPTVHLRRTPSLSKLDSNGFQVPEVSLRRTPSLPRLPTDSFQVPEVRLRRTPSLPRLEPDSFQVEPVYLRHAPQYPSTSPEFFQVPHIPLNPVPHPPRSPEIEHFTLTAVHLNPTYLWVAKDDYENDDYGYSQSELMFMDEDHDNERWSPRPFSPNILNGRNVRAISPSIQHDRSDQYVEPTWVQIANKKQEHSLNWAYIDQQEKTDSSAIPWKDVNLRETKKYQQRLGNSRIDSQESVSSWEWVDTHELENKSHDEKPGWVEVAQQRQHKYEKQEIDESMKRSTPSPTIPTWKTQIRLRATPGIPTKDDIQIKTDYLPRGKFKSSPLEPQSRVVRPEWLQNVKLKRTAHLTEVKGPSVGRVVNPQFSETPKKTDKVSPHQIVRPRSPLRSPPISRKSVDDFTVDHVLSSIRLIREASSSSPNLRATASTGRNSPISPHWRSEREFPSPTTKYPTYPRPASPNYGRRSPDLVEISSTGSFATPPRWLQDLKTRVKHKRVQTPPLQADETITSSSKYDKRLSTTPTKRGTWSPRTNFGNVLDEIRNVNRSDILTDVRSSRRYGSLKHTSILSERAASPPTLTRASPALPRRSPSPRSRSPSPTEKMNVSETPKSWWVQVPSEINAADSESRLKKFEEFLQKRTTSSPRSPTKPYARKFSPVIQKSPDSAAGRRTPSPTSRRTPSPQDRSESPTCSRYLSHLDRAQSGSDVNLETTPTKVTKITVAPKSRTPKVVAKKTTPKPKSQTFTKTPTAKTARSPLPVNESKLKSSPGKQRTTLTIGTSQSSVQSIIQRTTATREKVTSVSPTKSPSPTSKKTFTPSYKKIESKERPAKQVTLNRVSPVKSSSPTRISKTTTSSATTDTKEMKGRFSQLLTDLSSPPGTLTRSGSLKTRPTTKQPEKEHSAYSTYPKKTPPSTTKSTSGSITSASLVRQANTVSSNTYNIRKPRVRFSATEIVWPLDQDRHSASVTTCHHPIQVSE